MLDGATGPADRESVERQSVGLVADGVHRDVQPVAAGGGEEVESDKPDARAEAQRRRENRAERSGRALISAPPRLKLSGREPGSGRPEPA